MNFKDILKSGTVCPCPWTGFILEPHGNIKHCVAANSSIGNIHQAPLEDIIASDKSLEIKQDMLQGKKNPSCSVCHIQETDLNNLNNISNRIYYLKELYDVDPVLYDDVHNFDLATIDLRWSNACNFACVYCGPNNSSKWAKELGEVIKLKNDHINNVKDYVFPRASQLKNVYLAGGEPMMMKENKELLELLLDVNPNVSIRINTNLSNTATGIFEQACKFKNVHWIVSIDSMQEEFEYTRHGGVWKDFLKNLDKITKLGHKITFNMLWSVLNPYSLFDTVDFLTARGFHSNGFVLGPITAPEWMEVRNLPDSILQDLDNIIEQRIDRSSKDLLHHGYELLQNHIRRPFDKAPEKTLQRLNEIDTRRNLNSKNIFANVYSMIDKVSQTK